MKRYHFFGYDGNIEGTVYSGLRELSDQHYQMPILEVHVEHMERLSLSEPSRYVRSRHPEVIASEKASEAYETVGKYGPFGDVIRISRYSVGDHDLYVPDLIGHLAYPKPYLAADFLPFIQGNDGQLFFICIRKRRDKGQTLALIGGLIDIEGIDMETAAQCVIREAAEEAGIRLHPKEQFTDLVNDVPNVLSVDMRMEFANGDTVAHNRLQHVGVYKTVATNREKAFGFQRVYQTTAYSCLVRMEKQLSRESIEGMIEAIDTNEVEQVVAVPESEFGSMIFQQPHHERIFIDAYGSVTASLQG